MSTVHFCNAVEVRYYQPNRCVLEFSKGQTQNLKHAGHSHLSRRHRKSSLRTLEQATGKTTDIIRKIEAGSKRMREAAGVLTAPIVGAISQGMIQTVVDAKHYDRWAAGIVESWGWNETIPGYTCGLAVRSVITLVGGAVGLACGVWEGGKQAHDNYNYEGILKGAMQAISNAFYACEPYRFQHSIT
jgi:hypothetical protein